MFMIYVSYEYRRDVLSLRLPLQKYANGIPRRPRSIRAKRERIFRGVEHCVIYVEKDLKAWTSLSLSLSLEWFYT